MSDTLGDRIRAKRQQHWDRADGARDAAKTWAKNHAEALGNSLAQYVDSEILKVTKAAKAYVDKRIAKLAADNNLTNNP